ncbi:MAG TPA: permease [Deltaproteobacteria bacterium]|nr:permease [Deltaproteobacteria bacterium]
MTWKKEWKVLALMAGVFLGFYYLPLGTPRFDNAVMEALALTKWYAREHVLLCLIPAFFIAGGIGVFVSQNSVMKYLGGQAKKVVAYGVASVSGTVLAVCSCTVLPLFAGIYNMGAGLGPATAFLYSGPAINVLAIILTARVLGIELGIARAVGAVVFSIVIGLLMHLIFRGEEKERQTARVFEGAAEDGRPLWRTTLYFAVMVGILVFANFAPDDNGGLWQALYSLKWQIVSALSILLGIILIRWYHASMWKLLVVAVITGAASILSGSPEVPFAAGIIGLSVVLSTGHDEGREWFGSTWGFAKQILPLLLFGVLVAGALLGRVGHEGLIPSGWIESAVGGNSIRANLFASVAGAFMYFATLTEIPILQGLIGSGMGKGPALALLLAGPALSLPNMLVIRSVMGTRKTVVFVTLVVVMATLSGIVFGALF